MALQIQVCYDIRPEVSRLERGLKWVYVFL
jgi:hypothetical protein